MEFAIKGQHQEYWCETELRADKKGITKLDDTMDVPEPVELTTDMLAGGGSTEKCEPYEGVRVKITADGGFVVAAAPTEEDMGNNHTHKDWLAVVPAGTDTSDTSKYIYITNYILKGQNIKPTFNVGNKIASPIQGILMYRYGKYRVAPVSESDIKKATGTEPTPNS